MAEPNTIPDQSIPSTTPNVSSIVGELESSLDSIFGQVGDETKSKGVQSFDTNAPPIEPVLREPTGPQDWEKVAKSFQSNYDKAQATLKIQESQLTQYNSVVEFYNKLYEDEEVRRAFISELEPDLIKPKEPHAFIQEALAKEFGKDFEPEDSEVNKPGSKSWLYAKRAEKLYDEAVNKAASTIPASLKDLRAKRQAETQKARQEALAEKQQILTDLKWDETTYNDWLQWAQKIKPIELAKLKDRINKSVKGNQSFRVPTLPNVTGSFPVVPNQYKQELDAFFGPN